MIPNCQRFLTVEDKQTIMVLSYTGEHYEKHTGDRQGVLYELLLALNYRSLFYLTLSKRMALTKFLSWLTEGKRKWFSQGEFMVSVKTSNNA